MMLARYRINQTTLVTKTPCMKQKTPRNRLYSVGIFSVRSGDYGSLCTQSNYFMLYSGVKLSISAVWRRLALFIQGAFYITPE